MAYDLRSRCVPADDAKASVAYDKDHAGAYQAGQDPDQIAVLKANDGDADNQRQIKPGTLRVWLSQRVSDKAVSQVEDETADKGDRDQPWQVKMRYGDDPHYRRACHP